MIRVWVDAALEDARLRSVSASSLDWGRRRMVRVLAGRGCGDVDVEAVVMVALLGAFGAQPPAPPPSTRRPTSSDADCWTGSVRGVRGRGCRRGRLMELRPQVNGISAVVHDGARIVSI